MPVYVYTCPACGVGFEVERRMRQSSAPAHCPECGAEGRKELTPPKLCFGTDRLIPVHDRQGLGRWHPALGRKDDPNAYSKNLKDMQRKLRERGLPGGPK